MAGKEGLILPIGVAGAALYGAIALFGAAGNSFDTADRYAARRDAVAEAQDRLQGGLNTNTAAYNPATEQYTLPSGEELPAPGVLADQYRHFDHQHEVQLAYGWTEGAVSAISAVASLGSTAGTGFIIARRVRTAIRNHKNKNNP